MLPPPKKPSMALLLKNFWPPSHNLCVSQSKSFFVNMQRTRNSWPATLPANGKSHCPSSWYGFACNLPSFALWLFAFMARIARSVDFVCTMEQPSGLATDHFSYFLPLNNFFVLIISLDMTYNSVCFPSLYCLDYCIIILFCITLL